MTDEQWARVDREFPPAPSGGCGRTVDLRRVVNAVLYRLRTGCSWEMLPKDFPPKSTVYEWDLEIVKRSDDVKGFRVLPHRWVVERTFGWLGRCRLFCREHEATIASSQTDIHVAMTHIMLRRLTMKPKPAHQNEFRLDHYN